jgi:pheromone shutdown protein TraB
LIALLGTGHVFDLRRRLQRELMSRGPDVVCLELDPGRLQALLARQRGDPRRGDVPVAYRMLAEFQDRLASEHGIVPGDEMLAAYEAAQAGGVAVELIDQDAQAAFRRLWTTMGLWEKLRFLGSAALSSVLPKWYVERELERLQGDYEDLFEAMAKEYPTVKRVLIDERNEHMAARLAALRAGGRERVVAVLGDGHVDGIRALLAARGLGAEVEVVRLKELRAPGHEASWSFSTEVPLGPG